MKILEQVMLIISIISFSVWTAQAQDATFLNIEGHADCDKMLSIQIRKTVGPTTSPEGFGDILEFEGNAKTDLHNMERENNTVWYKLKTKTNGKLTFTIEPLDSLNDYDFALYKYEEDNFCERVKNKEILPIRTNFSRNDTTIKSVTGLSILGEEAFVGAGINPAFSQALPVKPKEEYVLLVNNVYSEGLGHILHFDYSVSLSLSGEVIDQETEKALDAEITLTNTKTGAIVAQTTSDSITGTYKLVFDLPKTQLNDPMHLEISKDDFFFYDTVIVAHKIATDMRKVKLNTRIKKIKKGDRFVVSNILFHGDSPKPLDRSFPSLKALQKTMKRNKTLKISVEGHTNGCNQGDDYSLNLSNARAATVVEFLLEHEIAKERMRSIGYGCQFMLHSMQGPLAYLNRRVEIEILEI